METYETEHLNAVRALAPEGRVLLRSDGAFPPPPDSAVGHGVRLSSGWWRR